MTGTPQELRERTKTFALRVLKLFQAMPRTDAAQIVGRQMFRSATSVAANYRAMNRARSRAEFIAKLGLVLEEMDETVFWLEMLADGGLVERNRLAALMKEANELLAIFAASQRTARGSR